MRCRKFFAANKTRQKDTILYYDKPLESSQGDDSNVWVKRHLKLSSICVMVFLLYLAILFVLPKEEYKTPDLEHGFIRVNRNVTKTVTNLPSPFYAATKRPENIVHIRNPVPVASFPTCAFNGTFSDNLDKLNSLVFEESAPIMQELGFDEDPPPHTTSLPVFVTGFNSGFFGIAEGLIKSIHQNLMPAYPDLKLLVFDMGLRPEHVEKLKKFCRCEVRPMPFDKLPDHVRSLKNYAFKPIIANLVYHEFGSVWWLDASARFVRRSLELPLAHLHETGTLFYTYGNSLNVALHTHPDTFAYFQEDPCPYQTFGEIEAGNVAFVNSPVANVILRQWVACALIGRCISPNGAKTGCPRAASGVGLCHRYDQSVLSVILRRLYHEQNDYPDWEKPFRIIQIKRGEKVNYFPST